MPVAPKFHFHKVTCTFCGWRHISVLRCDEIHAPRTCNRCSKYSLHPSTPNVIECIEALPQKFVRLKIQGRISRILQNDADTIGVFVVVI